MKRLTSLLLCAALLGLVACSDAPPETPTHSKTPPTPTPLPPFARTRGGSTDCLKVEAPWENYKELLDFFRSHSPKAFAIVRVTSTEQYYYTADCDCDHCVSGMHIPTLEVLETLWYHGEPLPQTLTVVQSFTEYNPFLMEGSTYLLPLFHRGNDDWSIIGDDEILFEIKDDNSIRTDSWFGNFEEFDGRHASELINELLAITETENFEFIHSMFASGIRHNNVLAEVTVLATSEGHFTNLGSETVQHTLKIDSILAPSILKVDEEITVREYVFNTIEFLEVGGRYLVLFDISFGGFTYVSSDTAARINDNGTITEIPSKYDHARKFSGFNGYTPAQMFDVALRVRAWHEMYS